jgi:hydroxyacylglutathione hydrolase
MLVKRYPSDSFTSNTFLITDEATKTALLVDIGEYGKLKHDLGRYKLEGLLLTHCHYDHIYYLNSLLKDFPETRIYGHAVTLEALGNPKANLSFYHDDPVSFQGGNLYPVGLGESGILSFSDFLIKWFFTPGHHAGSISYQIANYLFTGDSFIPGIPVVTKLKGGSKEDSLKSVTFLKHKILGEGLMTAPGHGAVMSTEQMLICEEQRKNLTIPRKENI